MRPKPPHLSHSTGFKALRAPDTPEMEKQYFTQWRLVRSALFQLDTMEVLVSLLASGACEKYPDFNFVLGELGVTWLPYVFDRLDTEYADRARSLNFKLKPSDYFHRQGYVTYQQDQYLDPIIPLIGEDNIIWGADYPHPDCIWPDSNEPRQEPCGDLTERAAQDHQRKRDPALPPGRPTLGPSPWGGFGSKRQRRPAQKPPSRPQRATVGCGSPRRSRVRGSETQL